MMMMMMMMMILNKSVCRHLSQYIQCVADSSHQSLVVLKLAASDMTYTAVHCLLLCVSAGWKPVCRVTSHQLQHSLFSRIGSKLACFPVLFLSNCSQLQQFCTPCIVVHQSYTLGHFNNSIVM